MAGAGIPRRGGRDRTSAIRSSGPGPASGMPEPRTALTPARRPRRRSPVPNRSLALATAPTSGKDRPLQRRDRWAARSSGAPYPAPARRHSPRPVGVRSPVGSAHAGDSTMGVRDRAPARPRHEADSRQLGRGWLGTGRRGARSQFRTARRVPQASQGLWWCCMSDDARARLAELGLTLPTLTPPMAAYIPAVQTGNHVYVSGQVPMVDGQLLATGKVGAEVTPEQGKELAARCALNGLAAVDWLVGLERVVKVVKVVGFVASAEGFTGQPGVINGASELLGSVLGEAGRHARSAIGVAELPLGAPVEVEMIVEVSPE